MFGYVTPDAMYNAILSSQWFAALLAAVFVYSTLTVLEERLTINLTRQEYFSIVLLGSAIFAFVLFVMPFLTWSALGGLIFIIVAVIIAIVWWRYFRNHVRNATIAITFAGLPNNAAGEVRIQTMNLTTNIAVTTNGNVDVPPGTYTLNVTDMSPANVLYRGTANPPTVTVTAGQTVSVTVLYQQ